MAERFDKTDGAGVAGAYAQLKINDKKAVDRVERESPGTSCH